MSARVRWLVGGGAVVAAVAIVAAAIVVLGARPLPEAMTYVPRESVLVAELRPDFPGDQLSRVGNLLAHFPGFKDQSILGQKLDETLAKLTRTASGGSVDYPTQVKPWLAGPVYAGAAGNASAGDPSGDYVVVFTTDGTVGCAQVTGTSTTAETYRGLQITEPDATDVGGAACAIDGRHAIVGSVAWVKAALDAHATNQGIDGLADYRAARDRLGGDRLATLYVARGAVASQLGADLGSAMPTLEPVFSQAFEGLPAWVMAGIRAEDNAIVADVVTAPFSRSVGIPGASLAPGATLLTAAPAHVSRLASLLPGDVALAYEIHGAGAALQNAITELAASPDLAGSFGQLDTTLGPLGGAAALVGWVGDGAVVVIPDGSLVTGGLVLLASDPATASAKADQLRGLVALAGLRGGITVTDTTIDGTKVTLVDLGDAAALLGSAGGTVGLGGQAIPPGTHVVLSIATKGSAVLVGSGESFARHILDAGPGSSLADQASYRAAIGQAAADNDGQLYVAAAPLVALVESNLPSAEQGGFESDVKPYLAPLDAFVETTTRDSNGLRIRLVLTVK